ncbi:sensor histidine kinase, partial [Staphylococcus aureus]|nr:sensor histidine kinase [Staphylococcus aureus]
VRIPAVLAGHHISVNLGVLGRVFDNVMSNLLKYADPEEKISITFVSDQEIFEIHVSNTIKLADITPESNGLGERSIARM